jgi:uncharacterized C2H2 Zn-finger protein
MPDYECDKCKKKFKQKTDLIRHINKLKSCIDNTYECPLCFQKFNYKSIYLRHLQKKSKCDTQCQLINYEDTQLDIINESNNELVLDEFTCNKCNKQFTTKRSLIRHQKSVCIISDQMKEDKLIDIIKIMSDEIQSLKTQNIIMTNNIDNTKNTQNIQNIQNNITVNAYGKEDISHITDKDYKNLFTKCNSLIPALIELIHFNEDKPENRNVYISNIKSPYAYVYDGNKWNLMNKDEIIDDIYDNKCIIIIDKFDDIKDILNKHTIELFSKFIEKHDSDIMKKNISDKIQLLLYNNRNLIKK